MKCRYCQGICIKKGCQNRRQKYYCKSCKTYQQKTYSYKRCSPQDDQDIIKLNNIGVGVNGISRFTGLSKAHVVNKIRLLNTKIKPIVLNENQQEYEIDEMKTFIQNKKQECYIIYAINKKTKAMVNLIVGSRTKENIRKVVKAVISLNPRRIFTDKLNIYPTLIDEPVHVASSYKINHIERFNLTLRTHFKRLARRTICFSKSKEMLENCLRLYFGNLKM